MEDETDDESGQSPSNQQQERIIVITTAVCTWRRKKLLLPFLPVCFKEEWKNSAAGGLDDLIGCESHSELSYLCTEEMVPTDLILQLAGQRVLRTGWRTGLGAGDGGEKP